MLDRMEGSLRNIGALEWSSTAKVLICRDARPTLSTPSVDFHVGDIDGVASALTAFAKKRGYSTPLTATTWGDVLVPFFTHRSPPNDKATATVRGVIISDPKSLDFSMVGDFIMDEFARNTSIYSTIEKVYYGTLVAEFLTQMEVSGNKASFKGLAVVYDAPVILRMLGCSGVILKDATTELHDTVRELGCRTYYFRHTYDEITAAIEAILQCYERGQPMFRETQEAIARGETTINAIYSIKAELDLRLAALGLTEHSSDYHERESDEYQIDEGKFKDYLRQNRSWGTIGSLAAERDVMSLALVNRLRRGREVRDLSKSGVIFVTHNVRLAVLAKEFVREEGHLSDGSVWPMMTVGQLSTIAWVANEVFQDERRISKELIANCYSAALPDDDFDARLKEVLTKTDPGKVHELYNNAFVIQSIRQVALSHTGGHSALVRTLNTAELLAEAGQVRDAEIEVARSNEREAAEARLGEQAKARRESKALRIANNIARLVLGAAMLGCAFVIGKDFGLFGQQDHRSLWMSAILFVFTVYGGLDVFGIIPAVSVRNALRSGFVWIIVRTQSALL